MSRMYPLRDDPADDLSVEERVRRTGTIRASLERELRLLTIERRRGLSRSKWHLLRQGFLSSRAVLYPLQDYPLELFLSDREIEGRLSWVNPPALRRLLKDKVAVHLLAESAESVTMPGVRGLSIDGCLIPHAAFDEAEPRRDLIAKPVDGRGGRGVVRLEPGDPLPDRGTFLIEEAVIPHSYAADIFPAALNTVRIYTGRTSRNSEALLVGAVHRFATTASAPADNVSAGGIVVPLDMASGVLGRALLPSVQNRRTLFDHHPETDAPIMGVKVPSWRETIALALRCADLFPDLVYAAWDIALTPHGPVLIECNATLPNPNLIQMHEPLLLSADVRAFLTQTGVISSRRAERAAAMASSFIG